MLLTLFLLAFFLLLYPLVIYPPLIWLLAKLFPRPVKKGRPAILPTLTIVIPAHNEEAVIADKIKNTLACDYPVEKVEILVASDGSTDRTAERAREVVHPSLFLLDFPVRRGKLSVLVDAVSRARGEIVVLTDASALLKPDALMRLVENFSDPGVGCVSGRYVIARDVTPHLDSRGESERGYFEFEVFQRRQESLFHSTLGAHGACYALRRNLFPSLPAGVINDDFVIPMLILAGGHRTVYEDRAVVAEAHLATARGEFRRRTRISQGNFQQIRILLPALGFRDFRALFVFFSHKVVRAFQPFYLVLVLILPVLMGGAFFRAVFGAEALFYLLGASGLLFSRPGRLLSLPLYFLTGNAAILYGFLRQILPGRGSYRPQWEKS
uniref:Glycosyltransferase family 2 protein n=1 Tax=Leptospirillum ferriphilum TaxID=178606 RepID=A0A7C3LT15_9BACT